MNENEYAYLGKLVAALNDDSRVIAWGISRFRKRTPKKYCVTVTTDETWSFLGDTPIAALEAALTALGIALPERGNPWHKFDVNDSATWPKLYTTVWVTAIRPDNGEKVTAKGSFFKDKHEAGWMSMENWGEYGFEGFITDVTAWKVRPEEIAPEPYQEATP